MPFLVALSPTLLLMLFHKRGILSVYEPGNHYRKATQPHVKHSESAGLAMTLIFVTSANGSTNISTSTNSSEPVLITMSHLWLTVDLVKLLDCQFALWRRGHRDAVWQRQLVNQKPFCVRYTCLYYTRNRRSSPRPELVWLCGPRSLP